MPTVRAIEGENEERCRWLKMERGRAFSFSLTFIILHGRLNIVARAGFGHRWNRRLRVALDLVVVALMCSRVCDADGGRRVNGR